MPVHVLNDSNELNSLFHADLFSHRIIVRLFFFTVLYLPTRTLAIISQKTEPPPPPKNERTNKRKSTADTRVNISDVPTFTGAQTPAEENLAAARFEF